MTSHPLTAQVGLDILKAGGNAADAMTLHGATEARKDGAAVGY